MSQLKIPAVVNKNKYCPELNLVGLIYIIVAGLININISDSNVRTCHVLWVF